MSSNPVCNDTRDYRLNWTLLGPITVINWKRWPHEDVFLRQQYGLGVASFVRDTFDCK